MKTVRIRGSSVEIPVGKILCLGRNYAAHALEMQSDFPRQPVIFLKPSTALLRDGEEIVVPPISHDVHHEVELVVAIAKQAKHIPVSEAHHYVLGYCVGLDMTLRDVQSEAKKQGFPWSVAKGFDTSAPISEIIPASEIRDPSTLEIRCSVNGEVRQQSPVSKMIFSIDNLISYISGIFTLERGDLIFTGTPEGVGRVLPGDVIEAELVNYTKITHRVISA